MKRRKARECALKILYQREMREEPVEILLSEFWGHKPYPEKVRDYASQAVKGICLHLGEIDGLISRAALNWPLERMSAVDRNILRLGTWELLWAADIPAAVSIDEAIELAKLYGTEDSPAFINGILDRIKKMREEKN
ncbi:MAG: transcription antitermination factor NusB [Candidatus Omnitrophica bacterium]|nr:transcription antitermination factor NusB [Candidatus Omnitrophota bacterium]